MQVSPLSIAAQLWATGPMRKQAISPVERAQLAIF
jgi:hypothetical protein